MIRFALILLGLLALFMAAGGIPVADGTQTVVFRTPVFVVLTGALGCVLILGCARYGRGLKRLVFWPAHLGVVVILVGAGLGYLHGIRGDLVVPVAGWHTTRHLPGPDGESGADLGFDLSVTDFRVDYYDPAYALFVPTNDRPRSAEDFALKATLSPGPDGSLRITGYGRVPKADLWNITAAEWVPRLRLSNGWILRRGRQTPREFTAALRIVRDGVETAETVRVNAPVNVGKWRIYLNSYGMHPRPYVQLLVRHDPGRRWVIVGIWMVIVGTALLCLRRETRA
jgi:hypothetical protein